MKLENKVAIVTGGSGGIGQGLCDRLAREGAKIVINYRSSESEAKEVQKKVEQIGSEALIVQADLGKVDQINNLVAKAIDHFGKVDILVNNAGLEKRADFWDVTEQDYDLVLDVNLKAVFFATQAVVKHFRETNNKGNVSSG